jgi:hypothetical protein
MGEFWVTARAAIRTWPGTWRLCVILVATAAPVLVVAILR